MDEDRPTLSYRTPAAAAPDAAPAPSEQLADLTVPMLGQVSVELDLGAPIRLSLDHDELRLTPGSGVRVRATGLPPLLLRHLRIDMSTAGFEHDATGLGAFEARAVSVALGAAFTHLAPWQPGRSVVDLVMQNLPQRADGRRRVWGAGPAAVWVDPDTRIDLAVTSEAFELALSHAVYLRVIGLGIGLLAVRYLFGSQRLELDGPRGQPLRNALLRFVAWVATRYLRKRLPPALATPGYDPFADPDRRAHFQRLAANFASKRPAKPVPTDSSPAPAPSDSHTTAAPAAAAAGQHSLAARLATLKDLRFTPGPLPPGARLIAVVPLGAHGSLALCTHRAGNLDIRRRGPRITLDASAGLFLHAEQAPGLEDLQIRHVAVAFGPLLVEVTTQPPLGSFTQAVIQKLARTVLTTKIPTATLERIEALGTRDELLRQPMGQATLTLTTPRNDEILLRHGPEALELSIPAGLELKFIGLDMVPDATIKGVRYTWATGDLKLDATPELGDLGNMFVTQLVRHRAAPHLPRQFGAHGPDTSLPIDPAIAGSRQAVLFAQTIPALGALQIRLNPADTVTFSLSASSIQLNSGHGVAVLMPDLQIALVLKHFRFEVGARGLATDMQLGDYLTEQLTRLLEKMALPPLQRGLPMWKSGLDPMLPWQIVRLDAGPLGPIDVNLGPGGAFVVERGPDAIEIRSDPYLEIRAERQDFVPLLAFRKIRWEPATDAWSVEFDPPVGPLIPEVLQRLVHKLAPGPLLAKITEMAALPAPPSAPLPPSAPPAVSGSLVYETDIPKIGAVRVCADPNHVVDLVLNRRAANITLGAGLVARMPGLGFDVQVQGVEVTLRPISAHLATTAEAGPLFDHVIEHTLRTLLKDHADSFWPTDEGARIGQDTLLVLGRGQPWGPLRVCVPTDGDIKVHLDKQGFALRSEGGIFISGQAIDWLPDFYLHTLGYTFETGAVVLEISGIEETYYHEKHPVSPVTQALLAHLIKVLALPKLPAWTAKLGLRSFPLPPVPTGDPARISMVRLKLPGEFGEVQISMPPDDTVTVRIDDDEASVISERGLFATLPGLRFELQLRGIRYHMHSGEIQVGGLGQLENALLEAVVARQLRQNVPQIASETPAEVTSALSTLLDQLPVDDKGRRVLFSHKLANLLLPESPCLIVRFTADGLAFTSDPPITIDGPARIDFAFNGIRYSFVDASFHLDLDNAGAAVSGLFTPIIINQAEKRLNAMFKPLLPAPMREPGYSLATDPRSEEHIADIIENFALLGKKRRATA